MNSNCRYVLNSFIVRCLSVKVFVERMITFEVNLLNSLFYLSCSSWLCQYLWEVFVDGSVLSPFEALKSISWTASDCRGYFLYLRCLGNLAVQFSPLRYFKVSPSKYAELSLRMLCNSIFRVYIPNLSELIMIVALPCAEWWSTIHCPQHLWLLQRGLSLCELSEFSSSAFEWKRYCKCWRVINDDFTELLLSNII